MARTFVTTKLEAEPVAQARQLQHRLRVGGTDRLPPRLRPEPGRPVTLTHIFQLGLRELERGLAAVGAKGRRE